MIEEPHILKFPKSLSFSDSELYDFCAANKTLKIERDGLGQILIMSPTNTKIGKINAILLGHLFIWNQRKNLGHVFDSSTGFRLKNKAMRSADLAWLSNSKWSAITEQQKEKFAPACPEFIVELKSPSDSLEILHNKMVEWITNGSQLGWLIDPNEQNAWIYRNDNTIEEIKGFENSMSGENILPEFDLKLSVLLE